MFKCFEKSISCYKFLLTFLMFTSLFRYFLIILMEMRLFKHFALLETADLDMHGCFKSWFHIFHPSVNSFGGNIAIKTFYNKTFECD